MNFGLSVSRDTQGRWQVRCSACGTSTLLSHLADIAQLSAQLMPETADFGVLLDAAWLARSWQRITFRHRDGRTVELHQCQGDLRIAA